MAVAPLLDALVEVDQPLGDEGRVGVTAVDGDERRLDPVIRESRIRRHVVAQIDVLETMTPRQFTGFRGRLDASSGFQSAQFRVFEAVLGRRDPGVLDAYHGESPSHATISAALREPSIAST